MKYALFVGCNIPARVSQYEEATRAVCRELGISLHQIPEFNCCGYPIRNQSQEAFVGSSARNLAMAEQAELDLLVMCKCCYGNLKAAQHFLDHDHVLSGNINRHLSRENLIYRGSVRIRHLLSVLYHDVGAGTLKNYIRTPFQTLSIAASYGCHALRPSRITQFDDPVSPTIFDRLVDVTGAHSLAWAGKADCCGAPLMGVNDALSVEMMRRKVGNARAAGADYLCTACPFTHIQMDLVQKQDRESRHAGRPIPPILYPQLLGLSMGLDARVLGIEKNYLDLSDVQLFVSEQEQEMPSGR